MNEFNFFKILEKGDKELVHSAMLAHLIGSKKMFRENFLKLTSNLTYEVELEKGIRGKKRRNRSSVARFDLLLISMDGEEIVVIENKFKSAPERQQLEDYTQILTEKYLDKKIIKKLFCFDKRLVDSSILEGWDVYDYTDLLVELESDKYIWETDDERLFIKHYCDLLRYYLVTKEYYERDASLLFRSRIDNDARFWRRLFNSKLYLLLNQDTEFKNFNYSLNPGNTSDPLLNIVPNHWKNVLGLELLIQVQGNDIKLYAHYNKKDEDIEKWKLTLNHISETLIIDYKGFEVKRLVNVIPGSMFIFKIKVCENVKDGVVNTDTVKELIQSFYRISNDFINEYKINNESR